MLNTKIFKLFTATIIAATLGACASQQPVQQPVTTPVAAAPEIPDWVMSPVVENGLADSQCVIAHPGTSMSILKSTATATARAELAKQINVRVKAMDKTFQRMTETPDGPSNGASFESISKQVTDQALSGSSAVKVGYVKLPPDNVDNLCVLITLSPEKTKAVFGDLLQETETTNLSPQNEQVLYERFLADKAMKEMEAEFQQAQ